MGCCTLKKHTFSRKEQEQSKYYYTYLTKNSLLILTIHFPVKQVPIKPSKIISNNTTYIQLQNYTLLVAGGILKSGECDRRVWQINITNGEAVARTPLPFGVFSGTMVLSKGDVFLLGSIKSNQLASGILVYKTSHNIWERISIVEKIDKMLEYGTFQLGSDLYILGGYRLVGNKNKRSNRSIYKVNLETLEYSQCQSMLPYDMIQPKCAIFDKTAYILGGYDLFSRCPQEILLSYDVDNEITIQDPLDFSINERSPVVNQYPYIMFASYPNFIIFNTITQKWATESIQQYVNSIPSCNSITCSISDLESCSVDQDHILLSLQEEV